MTTRELSRGKNRQQSSSSSLRNDNSAANDRYRNLNLHNANSAASSIISSSSVASASKNALTRQQENYASGHDYRTSSSSSSSTQKKKPTNSNFHIFSSDEKEQPSIMNDDSEVTTTTNSSTLSLHIAAYEYFSDPSPIIQSSPKESSGALDLKELKSSFIDIEKDDEEVEFPRQQKDEEKKQPAEIMQFKASQKLLDAGAAPRSTTPEKSADLQNLGSSGQRSPQNSDGNGSVKAAKAGKQLNASAKGGGVSAGGILTPLERLAKEPEMKCTYVSISMPADTDSLGIVLSSNMVIKSIKDSSCALYQLIIGDQILNIAGHAPTTSDHAIELIRQSKPKFVLVVNRPQNREPVPYARAASIQLKRHPDYAYFVVKLKRFNKVHLGLGIRAYQNKVTVNRTDENSLAAFSYLVGDSILDVNCERITDVQILQKRLIDSLVKYGQCNTVVERAESAIAIQNTRTITYFTTGATIDPPMPGDVMCIAQREIVRHKANQSKVIPKGVYRHIEPAKDYEEKSVDCSPAAPEGSDTNVKNGGLFGGKQFRRRKSSSDQSTKKKVTFTSAKPTESAIASDVPNQAFLQKIGSNQRPANSITFMPKQIFNSFTRRTSSLISPSAPAAQNDASLTGNNAPTTS